METWALASWTEGSYDALLARRDCDTLAAFVETWAPVICNLWVTAIWTKATSEEACP